MRNQVYHVHISARLLKMGNKQGLCEANSCMAQQHEEVNGSKPQHIRIGYIYCIIHKTFQMSFMYSYGSRIINKSILRYPGTCLGLRKP